MSILFTFIHKDDCQKSRQYPNENQPAYFPLPCRRMELLTSIFWLGLSLLVQGPLINIEHGCCIDLTALSQCYGVDCLVRNPLQIGKRHNQSPEVVEAKQEYKLH